MHHLSSSPQCIPIELYVVSQGMKLEQLMSDMKRMERGGGFAEDKQASSPPQPLPQSSVQKDGGKERK